MQLEFVKKYLISNVLEFLKATPEKDGFRINTRGTIYRSIEQEGQRIDPRALLFFIYNVAKIYCATLLYIIALSLLEYWKPSPTHKLKPT